MLWKRLRQTNAILTAPKFSKDKTRKSNMYLRYLERFTDATISLSFELSSGRQNLVNIPVQLQNRILERVVVFEIASRCHDAEDTGWNTIFLKGAGPNV